MAKTASKYISFDSDGHLVADEGAGAASSASEVAEGASLKAAVAYALDAIVDAASALPENAAALIAPAQREEPADPEEATLTVARYTRSTIGDDFAVSPETAARPRALVVASAKNARAFVGPMEQAGLDVVFATVDNRSLDGFARRQLPTYNLGSTSAAVSAEQLSGNIYTVLSAAKECGASLIFLDSPTAALAEDEYFLRHARKRGLRVFAPAAEGTQLMGWMELLPAADGLAVPTAAPWESAAPAAADDDEGPTHWRRCHACKLFFDKEEIISEGFTCPACGTLQRLRSDERLALTVDAGSFEEWNAQMADSDPLAFPGYPEKIADQREKSGLEEAVRTGRATIAGLPVAIGVMESGFFMGSMGHVVGEKVAALIDRAIEERLPVVVFCASGGARMQEGLISLMQMAKVSCAVERLGRAALPFITVLTDPTTGGVTASFAMQGDIILAEPGALIGFAGQRVIRDTIKQELPEGFQTAEFALEHGLIDAIVERSQLRSVLAQLLALHAPSDAERVVTYHSVMDALQVGAGAYGTVSVALEARMAGERLRAEEAASGFLRKVPVVGGLIGRGAGEGAAEEADRRELDRHARREARRAGIEGQAAAGSAWESVQIARNVHRPTARRYIDGIVEGFIELHGDRSFADDGAILAGVGWISGHPVTVIAQEKGVNLADRVARNFGCPQPEGYRKSLRLMREAEKFDRPILCLVDTQGAFCGTEAEERGQGNAIADNLVAMAGLRVPVVSVLLGEGGSGGALALAVSNRVAMQEHAVYSVLSPEGFASILWKDGKRAPEAAEVMKMNARAVLEGGIVDAVISEGEGPAHENPDEAVAAVRDYVREAYKELADLTPDELIAQRQERFARF
ncbi:acetyl-CoA carboxylase, carboxyltransferase subunit beta [Adlercreutzia caecimuris]|uniref:acetyl-CoA carboxylase, carboxyltransferase subunit beta n=1 Tax=Adlercreutzia caecimuris TaxID=671266 RepID=UPI00137344EC|nr:acetyl-CoA carboxylase, carboxyltransferase subunit beta [Adlercreutzia caecimuris]MCR2037647.1 acetyl-CoA carboxylase, carboxyltransferase subunit beta [Adlercreutzia caecimuris]NBJ66427.1 acetyl-CoA carboxylase, carboxyltransferase subunit beta [Adlercreutzia caecimuris]